MTNSKPAAPTQRYRYMFRTLVDPAEYYSTDAGPFTPQQAVSFGQDEVIQRTTSTGRTWVWNYEPLPETGGSLRPRLVALGLFVFMLALIVVYVLAVLADMFKQRADETCRERAKDGVTLCRGDVYAVNVLGEIECACRLK